LALRIERRDPITLEQWRSFVRSRTDLELNEGGVEGVNPFNAMTVTLPGKPGRASVNVQGKWKLTFFWAESGVVTFRPPAGYHEPQLPLQALVQALATALRGNVVPDFDC